jgi:DNA-binding NtrC family response regulator
MSSPFHILVVDDNDTMREGIADVLTREGFQVAVASNAVRALELFSQQRFDCVISDYKMKPVDGLTLLRQIKEKSPDVDVILITAFGTVDVAVEVMKAGASDFVTKPFAPDELTVRVKKIIELSEQRRNLQKTRDENVYLRSEIQSSYNFGEVIGQSPEMKDVMALVQKSAGSSTTVLIYGESGTGKELVARAIHYQSARRDRPFIKVNCAALTETLLESELFGHEKGAFTGAVKLRKGRFELADTGTLFLDEIGEISPSIQVKLLRVLQEQEFERVGGEMTLSVDTRVIAATNKDLKDLIEKGRFREDLYYRLHVIPITIPPLRERKEDIPLLLNFFVKKFETELGRRELTVSEDALNVLMGYDWPGNVRELENVVERAVVLAGSAELTADDFAGLRAKSSALPVSFADIEAMGLTEALEQFERVMIERALSKSNGGRADAAKLLGLKTSAFYYKLEKYGLL